MNDAADGAASGRGGASAGDRSRLGRRILLALALAALGAGYVSVALGPSGLMPLRALEVLAGGFGAPDPALQRDTLVIVGIRLPRMLFALLVGAALGAAGCVMQSLFRNPLADPALIGASSTAALAAVAVIVLGDPLLAQLPVQARLFALPAAAIVGALAATVMLTLIATREGQTSVATMLLAGIAVAALTSAAIGLLIFVSDERQLRDLTFWTLGSLGSATWPRVAVLLPIVAAALLVLQSLASDLDAMLLGEAEAHHLGVDVERVKRLSILAVAAAIGGAVGMSGVIGFVGIVVPHLLRLVAGPLHRTLIPASALGGAVLLTLSDTACRIVVAPAELPIGILTALFGAPFFLWLLIRGRALASF